MRLSQVVWLGWWGGTILIVLSWSHVVSPTVGWIGFGIALGASGASVVANRYWRFPREQQPGRAEIDPRIAPSDAEAIRSIIQDLPNVDKRIISMHLIADGTVRVMTGLVRGPRLGSGQNVTLVREAERWRVTSVERWVS